MQSTTTTVYAATRAIFHVISFPVDCLYCIILYYIIVIAIDPCITHSHTTLNYMCFSYRILFHLFVYLFRRYDRMHTLNPTGWAACRWVHHPPPPQLLMSSCGYIESAGLGWSTHRSFPPPSQQETYKPQSLPSRGEPWTSSSS